MTRDRWNRIARTALQAAIPALILLINNLVNAVPSVEGSNWVPVAAAVGTVLVSFLHNLADAAGPQPPDGA